MTISKSQIRSKTNSLEFRISVIVIWLVFEFCYLKFKWLTPEALNCFNPSTLNDEPW